MPGSFKRPSLPVSTSLLTVMIMIAAAGGYLAGLASLHNESRASLAHFHEHTTSLRSLLLKEIEDYTEVFNNINALFLSDERVREVEWDIFIRLHDLPTHLPGAFVIGGISAPGSTRLAELTEEPDPEQQAATALTLRHLLPLRPDFPCLKQVTPELVRETIAGMTDFTSHPIQISPEIDCRDGHKFYLLFSRLPEPVTGRTAQAAASAEWIFIAVDAATFIQTRDMIDEYGISFTIRDYAAAAPLAKKEPEIRRGHFYLEDTIPVFQKTWQLRWDSSSHFSDAARVRTDAIINAISVFFGMLAIEFLIAFILWRRKDLRDRLDNNETRLQLLIRHSPAAIAMFDTEMRYIMASDRWASDYGLEPQNLAGRCHYDVFPEILQRQDWLDDHRRALQGEVIQKDQDFWIRSNGKKEWIKYRIHPWTDSAGKVGGIVMFTEVITARKATEDALRDSEQLFRLALENASIGKALVYTDGRFMKVNEALCQMVGYSEEELMNRDFQSITHPDDLSKDMGHVTRMLNGDENSFSMEKRYLHKDGHVIWVLLSASLLRDEYGNPKHFISQMQDITESKQMEEMKDDFISIIGHELKTPVTSISLSLDLLKGALQTDDDPHTLRIIEAAQSNSIRLTSLINDVLDLRKMSAGLMAYDLHPIRLKEVMGRVVRENEFYGRRYNVTFRLGNIGEDVLILADEARIAQVLTNFLSNAAKFSPPGSEVDITVVPQDENRIRVCVSDCGPGIPSEFRSRIFQKFAQADSSISRKQEGSGLGLHISKEMVEKMGGKIGFDSVPGTGSCFWFEFARS